MPPTRCRISRRQATAAAKVKTSRLRPGTKLLGRPSCPMAKATSRVSEVSLIWPSTPTSTKWSSPQVICPLREPGPDLAQDDKSLIQLDSMALAVVERYCLDSLESL